MKGEKRAYDRLNVIAEVVLTSPEGAASLYKGRLQDLSFGGFAISAEQKTEPLTEMDFALRLPALGETIDGKGIVRHATENLKYKRKIFIIGIEFMQVDKDALTYIMKKIQRRIAQERRGGRQIDAAHFIPY